MELIAENINKKIKERKILNNISLLMESGNVYGFWGRNGSGKTMLFRALSGLMKIDSGKIFWNNQQLHKDFSVLPSLGIIIEHAGLYPNMTGMDNLLYLADIKGIVGKKSILHWTHPSHTRSVTSSTALRASQPGEEQRSAPGWFCCSCQLYLHTHSPAMRYSNWLHGQWM